MDNGCLMEIRGEEFENGIVRSRSFGSKRVAFTSNDLMELDFYDSPSTKKLPSAQFEVVSSDKSPLECLSQDVLIRVLCGVDHDDLRNLILISKTICEATLAAKELHFLYNTPRKTVGFRDDVIADDLQEMDVFGVLAPKASKFKSRLSKKSLSEISMQLFAHDTEIFKASELLKQ